MDPETNDEGAFDLALSAAYVPIARVWPGALAAMLEKRDRAAALASRSASTEQEELPSVACSGGYL